MPHIVVEYANNLADIPQICQDLHQLILDQQIFTPDAVKSRSLGYENYFVGAILQQTAFIHVRISILTGREQAIKEKLSCLLFDYLKQRFPTEVSISVELHEMDKTTYRK